MAKKNKVLKGVMFIVPNPLMAWGRSGLPTAHDPKETTQKGRLKSICKQLGCPVSPTRMFAQVWITSPESNNWHDHGVPAADKAQGWAPQYLPAKALYQAGEGGVIKFEYDGYEFHLTLKTRGYRYGAFGNIEDCLETLKQRGMNFVYTEANVAWADFRYGQRDALAPCRERWA